MARTLNYQTTDEDLARILLALRTDIANHHTLLERTTKTEAQIFITQTMNHMIRIEQEIRNLLNS